MNYETSKNAQDNIQYTRIPKLTYWNRNELLNISIETKIIPIIAL